MTWRRNKYGLLTRQRGIICAAVGGIIPAGGAQGTLALTALSSSHTVFSGQATAGVRVHTNEDVQELVSGSSWFSQNPGTEWIDDAGGQPELYEVQMDTGSLLGNVTFSGPTRNQYHTISLIRQWTITANPTNSGTFSSTLRIREIANTANNVSATVFLSADAGGL